MVLIFFSLSTISLVFIFSLFASVEGNIEFKEITNSVGLDYSGKTWGAYWGDFNGDDWPDLFTGNHGSPKLYLNNKNGTFTDISKSLGLGILMTGNDPHGASWADFDNDGDEDLIVLTGANRGLGEGSNFFLVNKNNSFQNKAFEYKIDNPFGRGRTPLWFDANNDGLLDLFFANTPRPDGKSPSLLFIQEQNRFVDEGKYNQFNLGGYVNAGQISDLTRDGKLDLLFLTPITQGVFKINETVFSNVINEIGIDEFWSRDMTIADFNGDLEPDIIFSGLKNTNTDVVLDGKKINSYLKTENEKTSFSFSSSKNVNFDVYPFVPTDMKIFVGAGEKVPPSNTFSLSTNDSSNWGTVSLPSNSGLYIGYKTNQKIWEVTLYSKNSSEVNLQIQSENEITNFDFQKKISDVIFKERFLLNTNTGFVDNTNNSGIKNGKPCESVVSGDFDNDMDVDVYFVCSTGLQNLPNELYENLGDGNFIKTDIKRETVGSNLGIGDSASLVDYNNDGFLDIFITNGKDLPPFSLDGPQQLFENIGNSNHWIQINLEGTNSNSDGIGARIIVKTENFTQIREQSGGMHYASQNHNRIHFGLGKNSIIESIIIFWPSGIVNEIENLKADQIILIREPESPSSPKHQISLGLSPSEVKCKKEMELVFKSTEKVACVKTKSLPKFIDRGWFSGHND